MGRRYVIYLILLVFLAIGIAGFAGSAQATGELEQQLLEASQKDVKTYVQSDKPSLTRYIDNPDSYWVVVNKQRSLQPPTYKPETLTAPHVPLNQPADSSRMQVRSEVAVALELMNQAAKAQIGKELKMISGYRSYQEQRTLYNDYVRAHGQKAADTFSARPGYSEHQTGLVADLGTLNDTCVVEVCFAKTPEAKWIAENAWQYGFIIRYPKGKTDITGYSYEPWHVRYVGKPLASWMHDKKIETMEEALKVSPAPSYIN